MVQIVSRNVAPAELTSLLRPRETPVFVIAGLHTVEHAAQVVTALDSVSAAVGNFNIADEAAATGPIINLQRKLKAINGGESSSTRPRGLIPEYEPIAAKYLELAQTFGVNVHFVGVGPKDEEYGRVLELVPAMKRGIISRYGATKSFPEMMYLMTDKLRAMAAASSIRNSIFTRKINGLLIDTNLPLAVHVGTSHLGYLENMVEGGNVIGIVEPDSLVWLRLRDQAGAAVLREPQTEDGKFKIARYEFYNFALLKDLGKQHLVLIEGAKAMGELDEIRVEMVNSGKIQPYYYDFGH